MVEVGLVGFISLLLYRIFCVSYILWIGLLVLDDRPFTIVDFMVIIPQWLRRCLC